jgi:cysteinyl-tRNA synthetase
MLFIIFLFFLFMFQNGYFPQLNLWSYHQQDIVPFIPKDPLCVTLYQCGPTVYDRLHVGNMRPWIVADVLIRWLKIVFPKVLSARNITDVDEKIIDRSSSLNVSWKKLTHDVIQHYQDLTRALGCVSMDYEPYASLYIDTMISITEKLVASEHAYVTPEGNVFLNLDHCENYGKLSNTCCDSLMIGVRITPEEGKHNPLDFALWKRESNEPRWSSPWGEGRPGWHLECAAMIHDLFPIKHAVDIHLGGEDLLFPHHENEMALSQCSQSTDIATYWVHNGLVLSGSEKMSKSLNNMIYGEDVLKMYPGEVIRWMFLSTHYRHPLTWTSSLEKNSKKSLNRLYGALNTEYIWVKELQEKWTSSKSLHYEHHASLMTHISHGMEILSRNLNTPLLCTSLHQYADDIFQTKGSHRRSIIEKLYLTGRLVGLFDHDPQEWFHLFFTMKQKEAIQMILKERDQARVLKNYKESDRLRSHLMMVFGIGLEDTPEGTRWYDLNQD